MKTFQNVGTATPVGRPQSYFDFGPDWDDNSAAIERDQHRAECAQEEEILAGPVQELMAWFGEGSPEWETISEIVARAAVEKAQMELERARFED